MSIILFPHFTRSLNDSLEQLSLLDSVLKGALAESALENQIRPNSGEGTMVEGNKEIVLKMNVSSFKPEDLKINLDGKRLTVEGSMKQETEHGVTERSFVRSYLLPESADLQGIKSTLSDEGELLVAVPKADRKGMSIPIERIQKHALEEGRAPENEEEKNA